MIIKNTTTVTKDNIKGVMYASKFDNKQYKMMKLSFNAGGLLFGMLFVKFLVPEMIYGTGNMAAIIITGLLCGGLLLAGMYGMDFNNMKKFNNLYGKYKDKTFTYEIDSEEIYIASKKEEKQYILWKDIIKWNEDVDNFYLFMDDENALIISKKGFTECSAKDLKELAIAIMGVREEEDDTEVK